MKRFVLLSVAFLLSACSLTSSTGTTEDLVGADRDAHGCIPSAGYQWCEPKRACIRLWEEPCFATPFESIAWELSLRHGDTQQQIALTMQQQTATHARASVRFGPEGTPGGLVLAMNKNGVWRIVYEGNGSVDCPALKDDGFPQEMLVGVCDG